MKMSLITIVLSMIMFFGSTAQNTLGEIPNFILFNPDNTVFTNRNLAADRASLFVFFDVTCDHCQHAVSILSTRSKECEKLDIYLISLDNIASVNDFINKYGKDLVNRKNVIVLQDLMNQFIKNFKPNKYPSVYLYSPEKKLILHDEEDLDLEKLFTIISASKK
ncbi:MAG: redoxin domain-containing protein [Bacteroidetes bacterium]|nr:redoxin domain-containing protein [Bacteroidota bacterium]